MEDSRPEYDEDRPPENIPLQRFDSHLELYPSVLKYRETPFGKVRDNQLPFDFVDHVIEDPNVANPIKAHMVKRALGIPENVNVDSVLPYVDLVETEGNNLHLFFEKEEIVTYVHSTGQIHFGDLTKFKQFARYESPPMGEDEFTSILSEIDDLQLETEFKPIVESDVKTNIQVTDSLESTQFKVDIERSEEYHRKIQSLESQIESLKANQNDQRRVDYLERQLEIVSEDAKDEIEKLQQSLVLKGHQLLDTQKNLDYITSEKKRLEDSIQSFEQENEDLIRKEKLLKQKLKTETNRLKEERDSYKTEKERLESQLETNIDSKQKEISSLVEENDRLKQQGSSSSSYQKSLQTKITELENSIQKLQDNYNARMAISQDQEKSLKEARRDIKNKEQKILNYDKEVNRLSFFEKRSEELESSFNEQKKIIKAKQKELQDQKQEYEEKISSLVSERDSTSQSLSSSQSRLQSLESEIESAKKGKSQLKKERDSTLSQIQQYDQRIKNLNTDINVYRNKIQSLEEENKTLKISMTKSSLDYHRQLEDIKEKIHQEKTIPLQNKVKELESSVNNYKHSLDSIEKAHQSSIQKYKEKSRKLNEEKKDLVSQLEKGDSSYKDLQRKLIENENQYSLLNHKYDELFQSSKKDIETLMTQRDEILDREKVAIDDIKYRDSRIEAKDKEVEEYKKQVEEKQQEIKDAYDKISGNDFYKDQANKLSIEYQKLHSDYNDLAHKSQQTKLDRDELELQLEKTYKELQDTKKKIIPDHVIDQLKHDVKSLNETLDERERVLKLQKKQLKDLNNSQRQAISAYDQLKATFENRLNTIRDAYEKELKNMRHKLIQTIRPGELKAIGVLLERTDISDFETIDYDKTIKELRSARDKFRRLSKDPNTPDSKKFLYDSLKDHMEYRIDALNLEFEKDIETSKGKDMIIKSKKGVFGLWAKMMRQLRKNAGFIISSTIVSIVSFVLTSVYTMVHGTSKTIVQVVKYVAPYLAKASVVAAGALVTVTWKLIDSLQWFADHIFEIVSGGIAASFTIVSVYGDDYSYPVLAFWTIVAAYTLVLVTRVHSYFEKVETIKALTQKNPQ